MDRDENLKIGNQETLRLHSLKLEEEQSLPVSRKEDYLRSIRLPKKQHKTELSEEGRLPTSILRLQERPLRRISPLEEQQQAESKNNIRRYYQSIEIEQRRVPMKMHTNEQSQVIEDDTKNMRSQTQNGNIFHIPIEVENSHTRV